MNYTEQRLYVIIKITVIVYEERLNNYRFCSLINF